MQKVIVYLLLLDFFSVTLQISDWKEITIPVSSPVQLKCDDDLRVNNIEVTIRRSSTTCLTTSEDCTLPIQAIETINATCNKQVSCDVDIRNITNNHSCLQDYGYFNVWYTCKTINDFSCDFELNLCNWLPVHDKYGFKWKRGRRGDYRPPTVDHTSAYLTTDKYEKGKWHHIQIPLEKTSFNSYQLVFKVRRGKYWDGSFGAIVIDDILIENKICNYYAISIKPANKERDRLFVICISWIRAAISQFTSPPFYRDGNLMKDNSFMKSNHVITGMIKTLKRAGKDVTVHNKPVAEGDVQRLY
ncbi:unnamed protein product [Mytilus coruscus]|uniref:MAM domain-containing protein n=1 Tax=Mytilus coruscus TaxID=42192 RepID=A0A6J8D7I1_MYTCO|nr:unnamed protein product [Mytilus coruscus]